MAAVSGNNTKGPAGAVDNAVNREKTCPLLLRVFCNNAVHNPVADYQRGRTPQNELQVYTWLDASLRELAGLVKEVNVEARQRGTFLHFGFIYPDPHSPNYKLRQVGTVCTGRKSPDDTVTLKNANFHIGDYVDVAIAPPAGAVMDRDMPMRERDRREPMRGRDRDRDQRGGRRVRPY